MINIFDEGDTCNKVFLFLFWKGGYYAKMGIQRSSYGIRYMYC